MSEVALGDEKPGETHLQATHIRERYRAVAEKLRFKYHESASLTIPVIVSRRQAWDWIHSKDILHDQSRQSSNSRDLSRLVAYDCALEMKKSRPWSPFTDSLHETVVVTEGMDPRWCGEHLRGGLMPTGSRLAGCAVFNDVKTVKTVILAGDDKKRSGDDPQLAVYLFRAHECSTDVGHASYAERSNLEP
jgi:hypothetical protein